jgi:hypothetical protein
MDSACRQLDHRGAKKIENVACQASLTLLSRLVSKTVCGIASLNFRHMQSRMSSTRFGVSRTGFWQPFSVLISARAGRSLPSIACPNNAPLRNTAVSRSSKNHSPRVWKTLVSGYGVLLPSVQKCKRSAVHSAIANFRPSFAQGRLSRYWNCTPSICAESGDIGCLTL